MTELSLDEFTCLMIAERGESMIPIGRWKPVIEHLVELGFLSRNSWVGDPSGAFNCVITPAGRSAYQARNQEDQDAFVDVVNRIKQQTGVSISVVPLEIREAAAIVYHWMKDNGAIELNGLRLSDG